MTHAMTDEPFAVVLSRAIQRRNLTLDRIGTRLRAQGTPVSIATLSYWQSGRSLPTRARSLKAVEHLEKILALPPGHLMSALPGDTRGRWDPLAVLPPQEQIFAVIEQMGLDLNRHVTTLLMQDGVEISHDGRIHRQFTRQLVRAEEDGLIRTPVVMINDGEANPPGLEAGFGCSFNQLAVLEDISSVVGELVLSTPLHRGDLAMFEYRTLRELQTSVQDRFHRLLASSVQSLVLYATFVGDETAQASYLYRERDEVPEQEAVTLPVHPGHHIQKVVRDAPAGTHTLRWAPPAAHVEAAIEDGRDLPGAAPDDETAVGRQGEARGA